ncbi:hypothetical protein K432DRAFT_68029 [Lepidopterella palustris CBS 459.81]|uniref:Uncharacterized protein n=1 Tax=Lepidopterella palustris CBS 459.81 TaxID=1314670 RepID=A0A8E2EJW2_9PEZI|nr:hypothetical protein K432DRAFT_68029 [Lepidopterella palustris CBS 459.81]
MYGIYEDEKKTAHQASGATRISIPWARPYGRPTPLTNDCAANLLEGRKSSHGNKEPWELSKTSTTTVPCTRIIPTYNTRFCRREGYTLQLSCASRLAQPAKPSTYEHRKIGTRSWNPSSESVHESWYSTTAQMPKLK